MKRKVAHVVDKYIDSYNDALLKRRNAVDGRYHLRKRGANGRCTIDDLDPFPDPVTELYRDAIISIVSVRSKCEALNKGKKS